MTTPPGIDRIVMPSCNEEKLRVVVLFPIDQRAEDLMMGAPSDVSPRQLGGAACSDGEAQLKTFLEHFMRMAVTSARSLFSKVVRKYKVGRKNITSLALIS
jgi:hypothetical protein